MSDLFGGLPDQTASARGADTDGWARLRVPDRDVVRLEVMDLDGLIGADHPARVIWSYAARG